MKSSLRLVAGLAAGCVAAVAIAAVAFSVLRSLWPAYAVAEPDKAYTLVMLFARLGVGVLCTAGAAIVASIVAGDEGRAAWWLGGLFLLISLPPHLYTIWDDYPAWYHFLYLAYLLPVAGCAGRLWAARRIGRVTTVPMATGGIVE